MADKEKKSDTKVKAPGWDNPPKVEYVTLEKAYKPKKNGKSTQKLSE